MAKSLKSKVKPQKKIEKVAEKPESKVEEVVEKQEESKPVEIKAKIEHEEKDLVMPSLYKCKCNLTKDGRAYGPGSVVKLSQEQVDRILKGNPEALEPVK